MTHLDIVKSYLGLWWRPQNSIFSWKKTISKFPSVKNLILVENRFFGQFLRFFLVEMSPMLLKNWNIEILFFRDAKALHPDSWPRRIRNLINFWTPGSQNTIPSQKIDDPEIWKIRKNRKIKKIFKIKI